MAKLSEFGGKDGKSTARTIAHFIAEDELYVQFSWTGTIAKANFQAYTNVLNVVLAAVRKKYKNFTFQDLHEFYTDYLKYAKSRIDRKKPSTVQDKPKEHTT